MNKPAALLIFFVSGFAALLYQVIWQRALAHFSGADVYSITIIVTAFMAGLGCGSLAGGYLADRLSPRARIFLFAAAELSIAGFALISLWLYHDLLYSRLHFISGSAAVLPIVLFISLLWPTFFMGLSLPLLARAMTHRVETASTTVGALYGINTLGAAAGAFAGTWIFMRTLGFERSVQLGAALNTFAALGAFVLLPRAAADESSPERQSELPALSSAGSMRHTVWLAIYGLSGFIALSLEIVWFRLVGVMTKPTAFSFGNMLGIFLTGLAAGTFIGIRWARASAKPAVVFFALQAGIPLVAGLSLLLFIATVGETNATAPVWAHLGQYDPVDIGVALTAMRELMSNPASVEARATFGQFLRIYVLVPSFMIGVPTLMMGISFPFLQRVVQDDIAVLGRRVGWLQAANIFGSMAGAVLTGWLVLGSIGTVATVRLLVLLGGVFLLLLLRAASPLRGVAKAAVVAGIALFVSVALLLPSFSSMWAKLHGTTPDRIIAREDGSGLSLMKGQGASFEGETAVYSNGLGQSEIPFPPWHLSLGAIPAMLHPRPESIAVIGLGSGATLYAAAAREETRRITLIEIIAPQLTTLRELHRVKPYSGLESILTDRRIEFHFADARRFLLLGNERYDIIEADALRPASAYAGNLYSEEYFELLMRHLTPGGYAVTWAPTERVIRTFVKVFPHAMLYRDSNVRMLIGSTSPIEWRDDAIAERLNSTFTQSWFSRNGIPVSQFADEMSRARIVEFSPGFDRESLFDTNLDLFPRDEFLVKNAAPALDTSRPARGLRVVSQLRSYR